MAVDGWRFGIVPGLGRENGDESDKKTRRTRTEEETPGGREDRGARECVIIPAVADVSRSPSPPRGHVDDVGAPALVPRRAIAQKNLNALNRGLFPVAAKSRSSPCPCPYTSSRVPPCRRILVGRRFAP